MVDVHTKQQRSFNMSRIKGKNTKPEIKLRKVLFKNGCRGFRVSSKITGKPDIVFTKKKIAVFIDGCYWHKCMKCFIKPKTKTKWWMEKINRNVTHDNEVDTQLKSYGWKVLRFWEHDINKSIDKVLNKMITQLKKGN